MSVFDEAASWINIKSFADTSESDGSLWAENIRIAAIYQSERWEVFAENPRWLPWDEIYTHKGFLGADEKYSDRDQKTVHTLASCAVVEAVQMLFEHSEEDEAEYVDPLDQLYYSAGTTPFDELSFSVDPIATVNLSAPDSVILKDFKKWLDATRITFERPPMKTNRSDRLAVLKDNQVLPYIWLLSFMVKNNVKLTLSQQAKILFPYSDDRYLDIDPVEKLRKRTIVLASEYINRSSNGFETKLRDIASLRFTGNNGNI